MTQTNESEIISPGLFLNIFDMYRTFRKSAFELKEPQSVILSGSERWLTKAEDDY